MSTTKDLGAVTAYASAVEGGYTGTYEDFCKLEAGFAYAAAQVKADATAAAGSVADAKSAAGNAAASATQASGYADSALSAATQAAGYAREMEYRLMIDPDTGCMALAHYTKEA